MVAAGLVTGLAVWGLGRVDTSAPLRRFPLTPPPSVAFNAGSGTLVGISPDGQTLIYRGFEAGQWHLSQWRLDGMAPVVLPGTEGASASRFVSPNSAWVAFLEGDTLRRVPLAGGSPIDIAALPGGIRGGSWGEDDTILLGLNPLGLGRVASTGGEVEIVVTPEGGRQIWYPQILPGGQAALFTASALAPDSGDVLAVDLETGEVRTVQTDAVAGYYAPSGHLVFLRGGDLWATVFDLDTHTVTGPPVRVESGIRVEGGGAVQFALSEDGSLVYLAGSGAGVALGQLVWVDQSGAETVLDAPVRPYRSPQVSPDGTRVAVEIEGDIWIWDGPGRLDLLTLSDEEDDNPLWLDDGQVAFRSVRDGGGIFTQPSDGTAEAVRLLDTLARPYDATPEGAVLYHTVSGVDIGVVSPEDAGAGELLVATPALETRPALSPNGRWLAYVSTESGAR